MSIYWKSLLIELQDYKIQHVIFIDTNMEMSRKIKSSFTISGQTIMQPLRYLNSCTRESNVVFYNLFWMIIIRVGSINKRYLLYELESNKISIMKVIEIVYRGEARALHFHIKCWRECKSWGESLRNIWKRTLWEPYICICIHMYTCVYCVPTHCWKLCIINGKREGREREN